jgi:CBS domain-containing protein
MSERTVFQSMAQRHVLSVHSNATIYDAACVMTRANVGGVLVIDNDKLLGIITERDLMTKVLAKAMNPSSTTVSEVMTPNPTTVAPNTKVTDAVVMMIERGFRHLPVINEAGKILGVFSARDALPREINTAVELTEFHEQVNDALG